MSAQVVDMRGNYSTTLSYLFTFVQHLFPFVNQVTCCQEKTKQTGRTFVGLADVSVRGGTVMIVPRVSTTWTVSPNQSASFILRMLKSRYYHNS